jgi:predicted enzyme related to lactoylglutathione lyase
MAIATRTRPQEAGTTSGPTVTGIDVHCYLVKEPERAIKFYRDVLGLPLTRELGGNGAEFELGDGSTFGVWKLQDGTWHSSDGVMFAVSDLAQVVKEYRKRGGTVLGEIQDLEHCKMAICQDTEGNGFILHQLKAA